MPCVTNAMYIILTVSAAASRFPHATVTQKPEPRLPRGGSGLSEPVEARRAAANDQGMYPATIARPKSPSSIGRVSRCLIIGNQSLALACAAVLQRFEHEVVGVVADPGSPASRSAPPELLVIPSLLALRDNAPSDIDFVFSITNLRVLRADTLSLARVAAINYHDGPLPRYSGVNAPVFALIAAEPRHGISWHIMEGGVDEGAVLAQVTFDVAPDESALTLNTRCFEAGLSSFQDLAAKLPALPVGTRAPLDKETSCPLGRRPPGGGLISWNKPARETARLIRALDHAGYPNPVGSGTTSFGGTIMIVPECLPADGQAGTTAGSVMEVTRDGVVVATGAGVVRLPRLLRLDGTPLGVSDLAAIGVRPGAVFDEAAPAQLRGLDDVNRAFARHEPYWMARLADLELPIIPGVASLAHSRPVIKHHVASAQALTREELLAAFGAWVARVAGRAEVDIGLRWTPPAGAAPAAPWFAPVVPVRLQAADGLNLKDAALDLRARLDKVTARGTWAKGAWSRHHGLKAVPEPAFDVAINGDTDAAVPGAALTCCARDGELTWWIDPGRIDNQALSRLTAQLVSLIHGATTDPSASLGSLSIVPAAESVRLDSEWNATEIPLRRDATISTLFEEQVARTPTAQALIATDGRQTYQELSRNVERLAVRLAAAGVRRGDLVGVHLTRTSSLVVGILAIHKAGGAYLPLDPDYPAERLAFMVRDAAACVILTDDEDSARLLAPNARLLHPAIHDGELVPAELATSRPEDLAYVIYTSGSTGRPKGVMVEHRNVVNFFTGMNSILDTPPGVWLAVTSLSFDISVLELLWTLTRGFTVVLYRKEMHEVASPDSSLPTFGELVDMEGATHLQCTPSFMQMLFLQPGGRQAVSRLSCVLLGGEPMPGPLAAEVTGLVKGPVWNMYGPTETTVWSTAWRLDGTGTPPPIGAPLANTQTYVCDMRGRPVPVGVPGELLIGGAGVVRGYLGRPELTAERFPDRGGRVYRTGDLVTRRSDGVLEFQGRVDFQVKLRGHRIELGEIEECLRRQDGVLEAVAMVREDVPGDHRLVAYVVRKQGAAVVDFREALRAQLPPHAVPAHVVTLPRLPHTPNLKVDRKALPPPQLERTRVGQGPAEGLEAELAEIWCAVLGIPTAGRDDNFFELGGHSLLAVQLLTKLQEQWPEATVRVVDIFRYPSIASLARLLGADSPRTLEAAQAAPQRAQPIWFGQAAQPLFGMLHRARGTLVRGAVLFCYPMPPKYQLFYRGFQRLAASLTLEGFHVLRFDYSGVGDSAGSPSGATVGKWVEDAHAALQCLERETGCHQLSVMGLRVGTVIAAALSRRTSLRNVVLWEPITTGSQYVDELVALSSQRPQLPPPADLDFFGFPVTAAMRTELQAVSLVERPPLAQRTLILSSQGSKLDERLMEVPGLRHDIIPGLGDWRAVLRDDQVVIPPAHLTRITSFLTSQ